MLSLFNSLLSWIFRASVIKFVIFTGLLLLLAPLNALIMGLVQSTGLADIPALFTALPNDIKFYLVLTQAPMGVPLLVAAYLTRFFIRRLPIVG